MQGVAPRRGLRGIHILDEGGKPISHMISPGRYFAYSLQYALATFTTMQFGELRPACDWVRWASVLQAMLGIALTGLLGFVLGNKIRRS